MVQTATPFDYSAITAAIKEAMSYADTAEVASLIINSKGLKEMDLIKRFQAYIIDPDNVYTLQLKLNVFQTMAALAMSAGKDRFMRHIVTRLPLFLTKYSIHVIESAQMSKRILQVFKKWQTAKTFSTEFYRHLTNAADLIFSTYPQEKPPIFVKYKKEFLMDYRNISQSVPALNLYESHALKHQGMGQLEKIQLQYSDLSKISTNSEEKKIIASNLKTKVQGLIQKFMQSLKLNKQGAQILLDLFQKQKACKGLFDEEQLKQPANNPPINGNP